MSGPDLELAREFLGALAVAARTAEAEAVYPLLAPDVEWLTPQFALSSVGEVRERMEWFSPREQLQLQFGEPELAKAWR